MKFQLLIETKIMKQSVKFQLLIETKIMKIKIFFLYVVFILHINVQMSTIVDIFTFMSRINFMLSCVEHEKSLLP